MSLSIKSFVGKSVINYKHELAKLRIEVFRDYPYLYEGTIDYEASYLETLIEPEESIIVVAFDGQDVIGVSTGLPLKNEPLEVQQPWLEGGDDVNQIYYFSESVLKKAYRGQGIGLKFFEEREKWAKQLGYGIATFCGVIRPENDRHKPKDYTPLDNFWSKRGYKKKEGYICKMSWKDIHETEEREKALQFWYKNLSG